MSSSLLSLWRLAWRFRLVCRPFRHGRFPQCLLSVQRRARDLLDISWAQLGTSCALLGLCLEPRGSLLDMYSRYLLHCLTRFGLQDGLRSSNLASNSQNDFQLALQTDFSAEVRGPLTRNSAWRGPLEARGGKRSTALSKTRCHASRGPSPPQLARCDPPPAVALGFSAAPGAYHPSASGARREPASGRSLQRLARRRCRGARRRAPGRAAATSARLAAAGADARGGRAAATRAAAAAALRCCTHASHPGRRLRRTPDGRGGAPAGAARAPT